MCLSGREQKDCGCEQSYIVSFSQVAAHPQTKISSDSPRVDNSRILPKLRLYVNAIF